VTCGYCIQSEKLVKTEIFIGESMEPDGLTHSPPRAHCLYLVRPQVVNEDKDNRINDLLITWIERSSQRVYSSVSSATL